MSGGVPRWEGGAGGRVAVEMNSTFVWAGDLDSVRAWIQSTFGSFCGDWIEVMPSGQLMLFGAGPTGILFVPKGRTIRFDGNTFEML